MPVLAEIVDGILVLTVDNPPVNALSQIERAGLVNAIRDASAPSLLGVVITGARGGFIAGADIREFGRPGEPPQLPDVVDAIEACPKPVVAAIAGHALGGGLEIALGCHFRIAHRQARLGLPEVTLGIVPGAGGTQRLPRLINPLTAATMIATGKAVSGQEAYDIGLVDALADGDLIAAALQFAKGKSADALESRRLCARSVTLNQQDAEKLASLRADTIARSRGARAAVAAIDLVTGATHAAFATGIAAERATFTELRGSAEAAALRHIFFAEKAAAKHPDLVDQKPRPINQIAVIGAGTMGTGIAMSMADAGLPVMIIEQSKEALERGLTRIAESYRSSAARGKIDAHTATARIASITGSTDHAALAQADLIVEAAFESIGVKQTIFKQLDAIAKPGAILATNTSYLDIDAIASVTRRPADVVGMHYFSPANVMRLLELVRAKHTAPEVLKTALAFAARTGKIPVISRVCHGFIGNRMLRAYGREAGLLLLEGASPAQVDSALTGFGMAMGPFEVADLSGIDIAYKARQEAASGIFEPAATRVHDGLVMQGMLGRKTGAGFYLYDERSGKRGPNPATTELIALARSEFGMVPRTIEDQEIVERCIYALANEGLRIAEEGIAARPDDADVVYVNGYGFPRHRGGPVFYAAQIGFPTMHAAIERFQMGRFGHWWQPAAAITQPH